MRSLPLLSTMRYMSLSFLKPRLANVLITLTLFSLPLLREEALLPAGGYEEIYYRPMFLLASFFQMKDFGPIFLLIGLLLMIYFAVSVVLAIDLRLLRNKGK